VPSDGLHPDIVETVKTVAPIILDDPVPDVVEAKGDVTRRNYLIGLDMRDDEPDEFHDRCLSASDGTGKQDVLVGVDPILAAGLDIPDYIHAQSVDYIEIFLPDMKFSPEKQLTLGIEIAKNFREIVNHFFSVEFPKRIGYAGFGDLRGVHHNFFDCWSLGATDPGPQHTKTRRTPARITIKNYSVVVPMLTKRLLRVALF